MIKIHNKILLTLTIAALGTAYFIWSSNQDHKRSLKSQEWVNHSNEIIRITDNLFAQMAEKESAVRGFVLTADSSFLDDIEMKKKGISEAMAALQMLVNGNPLQEKNVKELSYLIESKLSIQESILSETPVAARATIASRKGKIIMDSIRIVIAGLKNSENKFLKQRVERNLVVSRRIMNSSIIGGVSAFLFILLILRLLNRDISLRKSAEEKASLNEIKYRNLAEHSGVVMFTADMEGYFIFINDQAGELTGFSSEELIGRHYSELVHPGHYEGLRNNYLNQVMNGVRQTVTEFPIITKQGQVKWVEQTVSLLHENNHPSGFQCIVKDISDRKAMELELRQKEAESCEYQFRIQAILDNTPLMMYAKDLEGKYTLVNKRFADTFQIPEEKIIGRKASEVFEGEDIQVYVDSDARIIETGRPVELEDTFHMADGDHHVMIMKFPLFDQENKLFGIGGIEKDITEMVRFRQQLISARKKAQQAERLQQQFLANMSHEIRTPMNGIIGMANLLWETDLSPQQREFTGLIRHSSDTLLVLINDILDLSKIKANKLLLENIPFDLHQLLQRIINVFRGRAGEKGIDLRLIEDGSVPARISGDMHRLEQVLNNLLGNAVKFTEKGAITLSVKADFTDGQPDIHFSVIDTGIGIAAEDLSGIFESFTQAGSDTSRKFGGTGLGLAICRNLVQMQKGSISVTSEPGKGSHFQFSIPYKLSPDQPYHTDENALSSPGAGKSFQGEKVLVVEDNEINQKVIFHHLSRAGISASIVSDGSEAIKLLEKGHDFRLIIMDLQMSGMNGFQTTTYIRKKLNDEVPIIALSASVLQEERKKCLAVGMNGFLSKPFSPDELTAMLKRFFGALQPDDAIAPVTDFVPKERPYDLSMIKQIGEENLICEVLDMFLKNTPLLLQDIREEMLHENLPEVKQKAHKLKGSVGVLQINSMLKGLESIEKKATAMEMVDEMLPLLAGVEAEFNLLRPMLEAEKEKNRPVLN